MPVTATGVLEEVVDPLPNWPDDPAPQHLMVLSASEAQVNPIPAETEVAFVIPFTATGVTDEEELPFPSAPEDPSPQHSIVPFTNRAQA